MQTRLIRRWLSLNQFKTTRHSCTS